MPYSITTKDGITLQNIPDDIDPNSQELKDRVMKIRAGKANIEPEEKGFGAKLEEGIKDIPRQLGLTARYAMEGPAQVAGIFTAPIEYGMNKLGIDTPPLAETVSGLADEAGLPVPRGTTEEVVGTASKMLAGVGGTAKAAQLAAKGGGALAKTLAAQPAAQLSGAVAGGASGEYTKQTGGGPLAQFGSALVGSIGGAMAPSAIHGLVNGVKSAANYFRSGKNTLDEINKKLTSVLKASGIGVDDIRLDVRQNLAKEIKKANDLGKTLDDDAIRRIVDYGVVGAKPTRGTATLDPGLITKEKNLAKLAANSSNKDLQKLYLTQQENEKILIGQLNRMGADTTDDAYKAAGKIITSLKNADAPRKKAVDAAYKAVRDAKGRYAELDVPQFSNMANNALDETQLGVALPNSAKTLLNKISAGEVPLNVNTMGQIDKTLSGLARDAYSQGDKSGSLAIKVIRDALWKTDVKTTAGEKAVVLYHKARTMAAKRFQLIDKNPALKAALDDVEPDKFINTYIIGSGKNATVKAVHELGKTLKKDGEAYQSAREQILYYLKGRALNQQSDEIGKFSPSNYDKALKNISDRKLSEFFTTKEISMLKTVGRVASYEKVQPTGSAVNNSNTASGLAGLIERVFDIPILRHAPLIKGSVDSLTGAKGARDAMNPMNVITKKGARQGLPPGALIPGLAASREQ